MLIRFIQKVILTIASLTVGISSLVISFTATDVRPLFSVASLVVGLLCLITGTLLWMPTNKWIMDIQDWWDRKNGT